jgi:NADPH:quinone reductase-like Zn-dependent oxidoreductase
VTKQLGAWGEVAVALETQLARKPTNISMREAGVLPKVALTSFKALAWHCDAKAWSARARRPSVLVLGGSSGCGTAAIQLARAWGAAAVHATCSARNIAYCRGLGAERVVDYTAERWPTAFGEGSLDVVYDCVGEAGAAEGAMATLRPGGAFVSIRGGRASAGAARDDVTQAAFVNSDTNLDSAAVLDEIKSLVERGLLRMRAVEAEHGLDDIEAALAASRAGRTVGKVAIRVAGEPAGEAGGRPRL